MEISVKSALGFELLSAPPACTSSPQLSPVEEGEAPSPSQLLPGLPCCRGTSTPLPLLVSA